MARKINEIRFKALKGERNPFIYRNEGYFKFEPKEQEAKLPYVQFVSDWRGLNIKEGKA